MSTLLPRFAAVLLFVLGGAIGLVAPPAQAAVDRSQLEFLLDGPDYGNGFFGSTVLGYVYTPSFPWIYARDFGWIYVADFTDGVLTFYTPAGQGFAGTVSSYPYVQSLSTHAWILFQNLAPDFSTPDFNGALESSQQVNSIPAFFGQGYLASLGYNLQTAPPLIYDALRYRMTYWTADTSGAPTRVSGLVSIPAGKTSPSALLLYGHGTTTTQDDVPSNPTNGQASLLSSLYSGGGYVTVFPDYIGLGQNEDPQPFVIATVEASTSIGALRAARTLLGNNGVALSGQVLLTGYSQGAHVALATQRAIEASGTGEFNLIGSVGMSGPYDLSGVMEPYVLTSNAPLVTTLATLVIESFQTYYGNVYGTSESFYSPEAIPIARGLINSEISLDLANYLLPSLTQNIILPGPFRDLVTNPNYPVTVDARLNDLTAFKPRAQVSYIGARGDTLVPYQNSINAYNKQRSLGGNVGYLLDLGPYINHTYGLPYAAVTSRYILDSYRLQP